MLYSQLFRIASGVLLAIIILGVLRYKPWQSSEGGKIEEARDKLTVGFLPVT
jgi:hypothetical protein